jgi:hypothetical protein
MSGFYVSRFVNLSSWQSTFKVFFQQLNKIRFVVEDTFSFGDFDPQIDYDGMTTSAITIYRTRYLKIYKLLWVSIHIDVTLAAPFSSVIRVRIPATATTVGGTLSRQGYIFRLQNAGVVEAGALSLNAGADLLQFFRLTGNYTAGAANIRFNGFFEVQ